MKFIHTADLHLASPFQGLTEMPDQLWKQIYRSTFSAFAKIVDAALDQQVDFVLIAGDIYDGERKSIAATSFFADQVRRLGQQQIPVFLCYGNHDYKAAVGPKLPANVYAFGKQVSTKKIALSDGTSVAVTGFSYDQRWIDTDRVAEFPSRGAADWQIGMLHGAPYQGGGSNHYAPFTVGELKDKRYDYWALGHIHKHQLLASEPPIVYSGNPQGRHKNEGGVHGYYMVSSHGDQLQPRFVPLTGITWDVAQVDLTDCADEAAVDRKIAAAVSDQGPLRLVEIKVSAAGPQWRPLLQNGSLLEHLQQRLSQQPSIRWWPYQLRLAEVSALPDLTAVDQKYWQQASKEVFTSENLAAVTAPLAKHAPLYDQLQDHQEMSEYRQLVMQLLGKRGDDDED